MTSFDTGIYTDEHWFWKTLDGPPGDTVPDWAQANYNHSSWLPPKVIKS